MAAFQLPHARQPNTAISSQTPSNVSVLALHPYSAPPSALPPQELGELSSFPLVWKNALAAFLTQIGFQETLLGLEMDYLALNSKWEHEIIPDAVRTLIHDLQIPLSSISSVPSSKESHDEMKETSAIKVFGKNVKTPSATIHNIANLIAENRARNDGSNKREFLTSVRERLGQNDKAEEYASCSRADAKFVDRDSQMKYDIAKNDDGPLKRTMKQTLDQPPPHVTTSTSQSDDLATDERLSNIEQHLALRYVPSAPATFQARLQYVEDHIVRLEKEYPSWAAVHFNQPRRGWPTPPRATPIVVSPHMRLADSKSSSSQKSKAEVLPPIHGVASRNTGSSLQRAVVERIQVKQALNDD
ncbi:hypothetical protein DL96DRAFT_1555791 [Flagelloscypha sp. PMI_526]|nr:hypothetical protein DL96DRAFT_1555791 [Flagelloscypha sp. PMI_526]